ncbi:organic hydroperoxide resistance protein [Actinoplanes sp. NPDC049118]|uniref:organic hydroperoxide resistance protein n=1 Tax=Actinoplanes sp. NPDC049118 TaxID=3155769 RepID=UPI0033FC8BF6
MTKPAYTAEAHVAGGRANGHGRTASGELDLDVRLPKELGGAGGGTNPEELFAVGYAACFGSALTLIGPKMSLNADDATIDSKVSLVPEEGGQLKLAVELDITLPSIPDAQQAAGLVKAAHQICPYSKATRGNINVALTVNGASLEH